MQDYEVSIQVSKWLGLEIRKEFEFDFQTTQHSYLNPNLQLHDEALFKHCSCYGDTRGVTTSLLISS
jgi:hypothetical protein